MAKILQFNSYREQRDHHPDALMTLDHSILQVAMSADMENIASLWGQNKEFLNEHSFIIGIFPRNSFKIYFYNKSFNKDAFVKTFRYFNPAPAEIKLLELKQWLLKISRQMFPAPVASNFMQHVMNWHRCLKPCLEDKKMIISDYEDPITNCQAVMALTTKTKGAYLIPRNYSHEV